MSSTRSQNWAATVKDFAEVDHSPLASCWSWVQSKELDGPGLNRWDSRRLQVTVVTLHWSWRTLLCKSYVSRARKQASKRQDTSSHQREKKWGQSQNSKDRVLGAPIWFGSKPWLLSETTVSINTLIFNLGDPVKVYLDFRSRETGWYLMSAILSHWVCAYLFKWLLACCWNCRQMFQKMNLND